MENLSLHFCSVIKQSTNHENKVYYSYILRLIENIVKCFVIYKITLFQKRRTAKPISSSKNSKVKN